MGSSEPGEPILTNSRVIIEVFDLMIHPQIRVYTKKPGETPDFEDGIILRNGVTVKHVCHAIHRTLPAVFKFALVWVSWKRTAKHISHMND